MSIRTFLATWLLLVAASSSAADQATEPGNDRIQLHGFASQAMVSTSANRFYGDSPNTSFDFTEIGLNASWRLSPRLLLAGQLLSRRAGEMSDGQPEIDFALADITLMTTDRVRFGTRIGRIKNRLGLYNETRDVSFTHPGIFLPQVVYFDKVRNLVLSSDGVVLYAETYQPFGLFSLNLATGSPVVDENVEAAFLLGDKPGDIEPRDNSWLAGLWYQSHDTRLKFGLSGAAVSLKFDPTQGSPIPYGPGKVDVLYWVASAQYNSERWSFTAEYMAEPIEWRDFGPALPDQNATAEGYYGQVTYNPVPKWQLMLRYEEGFADRDDRSGRQLERQTLGLVPSHATSSHILSLGLRWDINHQWMLKTEYQRHNGNFILSEIENPDFSRYDKHWDLFAVQAGFRF
ncbi:MAG: hypothetical protein VBE63_00725 [Lamprobacter sp.]|uniref:hypothetical protein n=1 Tax=Lamprobacter sp. TaxID=3100796 RepID=UPI002B259C94|nr:hypothetical protein [Lamprobacter sp.]MEA3638448.1 hypothetical protein [Lamprobacter sp.]